MHQHQPVRCSRFHIKLCNYFRYYRTQPSAGRRYSAT